MGLAGAAEGASTEAEAPKTKLKISRDLGVL
jgi:hypothetical protein